MIRGVEWVSASESPWAAPEYAWASRWVRVRMLRSLWVSQSLSESRSRLA